MHFACTRSELSGYDPENTKYGIWILAWGEHLASLIWALAEYLCRHSTYGRHLIGLSLLI